VHKPSWIPLSGVHASRHFRTFRTFRTSRQWSKKLSDGAPFFRSPSRTPQQRTTGTTGCSSPRELHSLPISGNATTIHPFYGDDASSFKPERFLDAHGKILPGPAETREEGHSTYGFGRRACVGRHVANDSLFIYMATTLWAANLERVRDKDGKETPLHLKHVRGHRNGFCMSFTP
jgi:cytochrome P450